MKKIFILTNNLIFYQLSQIIHIGDTNIYIFLGTSMTLFAILNILVFYKKFCAYVQRNKKKAKKLFKEKFRNSTL